MSAPTIDAPAADLAPGGSIWKRSASASKLPAMLDISPFESKTSLWLKMKYPDVFPDKSNESQERGNDMEEGCLKRWFRLNPRYERLSAGEVTFTRTDLGYLSIGTPDCRALDTETGEIIDVENKTVGPYARDLKDWGKPGTDIAPEYYLVQIIWQQGHSGANRTALIKNGPFIDDQDTYWVHRDLDAWNYIESIASTFMLSLEMGIEPELDGRPETYDAIRLAYWEIDRKEREDWEVNLDLAIEYTDALECVDAAEKRLNRAKSDVLKALGPSRRAFIPHPTSKGKDGKPIPIIIATRMKKGAGVSLTRPKTRADLELLRSMRALGVTE